MRILELQGTPREVGRQYGEACRESFHELHERAMEHAANQMRWYQDIHVMHDVLRSLFPGFLAEIEGAAEGANMPLDDVLLNHRSFLSARELYPAPPESESGCTNLAFLQTPTGPIFGKNLDLSPDPDRDYAIRDVTYDDGSQVIHSVVEGEITARDTCMNGHGLTIGGSSVGSVFQQSIHNPPIEAMIYEMLRTCATTEGAIRFLQQYPCVGKGYNFVMVDEQGDGVALECACPMVQVRRAEPDQDAIYCTNIYQLPALSDADLRTPQGELYSRKRNHYLDRMLFEERVPRTVEQMQALLSAQGDEGGLCRPIDDGDYSKTRMSVVTVPAERAFWFTDGQPCAVPFEQVT